MNGSDTNALIPSGSDAFESNSHMDSIWESHVYAILHMDDMDLKFQWP